MARADRITRHDRVTVTDRRSDLTVTCSRYDVEERISKWFLSAPGDVFDVLADLQVALDRHEPIQGFEDFLLIDVRTAK